MSKTKQEYMYVLYIPYSKYGHYFLLLINYLRNINSNGRYLNVSNYIQKFKTGGFLKRVHKNLNKFTRDYWVCRGGGGVVGVLGLIRNVLETLQAVWSPMQLFFSLKTHCLNGFA